jgi:hypothetical protein
MRINPDHVRQQVSNLLRRYPELAEDEEGLALSIESETEVPELLAQLVEIEADASTMAAALETRIADMKVRSDRYSRRGKAARELAHVIMFDIGLQKLELPEATLSIRNGSVRVVVPDDAAIPDRFCRFVRQVDRTALKAALDAGEPLNYAALERGPDSLTIRRK